MSSRLLLPLPKKGNKNVDLDPGPFLLPHPVTLVQGHLLGGSPSEWQGGFGEWVEVEDLF